VADIKDMKWSSSPFDCLTVPDNQRETIMAIAEARTSREPASEFDDIVDGKGRGINALFQYDGTIIHDVIKYTPDRP
jgi:hypothetical protein